MKNILVALFAAANVAHAGVLAVGDVAVVEDTSGTIHANVDLNGMPMFGLMAPGGMFCRDTAKLLLPQLGDNFDGIFTFTPKLLDDIMNVQQGQPVRWSDQGIGANGFDWGSQFNSPSKLSQCVFMGSLPKLPAQPDGPVNIFLGLPLGITGTELMGHEYGHHWMTWVHFDKNDGRGSQDLLRGYDDSSCSESNCTGTLNGHYGYHVNSHSVMYGNFITDNGNGTFSLSGGARKYGELDQYLMGLRGPTEVSPVMVLDDGSHHSSPAGPHGPNGTDTVNGMSRVDVTIPDIVRAEGVRSPAYPNAQSCWRVAFVLTVPQGQTYSLADVQKVEAYRARWQQWFTWATDGRGTMDARLTGNGCLRNPPPTDAGVPPVMDAGTVVVADDGGAGFHEVPYMTSPIVDDSPTVPADEMKPQHIPTKEETRVDLGTAKLRPGCGCGAGGELFLVFGALALAVRSRRRPT